MSEAENKDLTLIHRFLEGTLSKEESVLFDQKVKEDAFKDMLAEETVKQYGRIQLKEKLGEIHGELSASEERSQLKSKLDKIHDEVVTTPKRRSFWLKALAIIITLLLFITTVHYLNNRSADPGKVFAEHFEVAPNMYTSRSADPGESKAFLRAYDNENYPVAIERYESLPDSMRTERALLYFYYANALMADQRMDEAINVLVELQKTKSYTLDSEKINWYLAIAYIGKNDVNKASPLLEKLTAQKENGYKKQEAKKVLKRLR